MYISSLSYFFIFSHLANKKAESIRKETSKLGIPSGKKNSKKFIPETIVKISFIRGDTLLSMSTVKIVAPLSCTRVNIFPGNREKAVEGKRIAATFHSRDSNERNR